MSNIPDEIVRLTDDQLRQEMIRKNLPSGPITETTRKSYQKRLAVVWGTGVAPTKASTPSKAATPRRSPKKQSLAAMSSEEEEDEPTPPPAPKPSRHATPPKRKSGTSQFAASKITTFLFVLIFTIK